MHAAVDPTVLSDVRPSSDLGSLRSTLASLPGPQRQRHDGLQREMDRVDYVAARALARDLVGQGTGVSAERIAFSQFCPECDGVDHGRPVVVIDGRPADGLSISWSHSGGTVAAAFGSGSLVGIDVERTTGSEPDESLLELALAAEERARVAAAPDRGRAFRDTWVRKEALVKVGAVSLTEALRTSVATILSGDPATTVTSWEVLSCRAQVGLATRRDTG